MIVRILVQIIPLYNFIKTLDIITLKVYTSSMDDSTLKTAIQVKCNMLYKDGMLHFTGNNPTNPLRIEFTIRGRVAGRAWCGLYQVNYNMDIARNNQAEFLSTTVPHEIAHLIARKININCKPHGAEWARVMRYFGSEPKRCHSFDCAPARKSTRKHVYICDFCHHKYIVTDKKHARVYNSITTRCHCGAAINKNQYKGIEGV